MPSDATRDALLDAAKRVMQRVGAGHLTLDAVAKEAGVSKGGLLYHFPSKGDLLRGMIATGHELMRQDLEDQMRRSPGPLSFARAFLGLAVYGPPDPNCKPPVEAVWSMLAATANDPSLLNPIRESQAEWGKRLAEERIDPDVANLIRLVGRGLWMTEIFGFDGPDVAERQRLYDLLAKLGDLNPPREGANDASMEDI